MTRNQIDIDLFERTCLGNQEARGFLFLWSSYVHLIDDLIDGDAKGSEATLKSYALALQLYTHPFFIKNLFTLRSIALMVTNAYADSVNAERDGTGWKKEFANHFRHVGIEMALAVGAICAGPDAEYDHLRNISEEWRTKCYHDHLNRQGEPA